VAAAADKPDDAKVPEFAVRQALFGWVQAWSARDFDAYVAAYTPDFKGSFQSRQDWLAQRAARVSGRGPIDIRLSDVEVAVQPDRADVRFVQEYRSPVLRSLEPRQLALSPVGERWLIAAESGR
jgi:hypothetical protein